MQGGGEAPAAAAHPHPRYPSWWGPSPPRLGGSYLQQGWVLQAQREDVLQNINHRFSCRLPFVVGPALIALEGLGVRLGDFGKGRAEKEERGEGRVEAPGRWRE